MAFIRTIGPGEADGDLARTYTLELTRRVGEDHRPSVGRLREAGLDDRGILDVAQIVAYFNFVNRLSEELGVALEPDRKD